METEKCRVLLHVVGSCNIRATADELGYTPSGISRMMSSLEKELGLSLLVRGKRGVKPTRECQALLPNVRRVVQAASACAEQARAICGVEEGEVRIGVAYPQFFPALTQAMGAFSRQHPGIRLSVREANSTPLAAQLARGELDFALMSRREGDFGWREIVRDRLVAFVPDTHPLAGSGPYPLGRFAEDPFIEIGPNEGTDNSLAFSRFGIVPNTCISVSMDTTGYEMVDAGLGVTLTNEILAKDHRGLEHAVALPTEPEVEVSIGAAWAPESQASPAARSFAEFALPRFPR